jgi:hypothetical protein
MKRIHIYICIIIACQECEYTPRDGYVSCEDDCFAWIGQHLGDNYIKLAAASLWAIRIVVFVRRELYYKITRLKTSTVATGLAKVIGNKGGAGISLSSHTISKNEFTKVYTLNQKRMIRK